MTNLIASFLAFGVSVGLLTYAHRHRFSEGSITRAEGGPCDAVNGPCLVVGLAVAPAVIRWWCNCSPSLLIARMGFLR